MARAILAKSLLRKRGSGDDGKVSFLELFFDVVFVFTIIQLSHRLAHHYDPVGALEAAILIFAVWWVWIYTTWAMNWLDPNRAPVRMLLFILMFLALLLSVAIPKAFEDRGLLFAAAFAAMQVGRSMFTAVALWGHHQRNAINFVRITVWLAVSGIFWIVGAFAPHDARLIFWLLALAIEYAAPVFSFWVPGLGRSTTADWDVSGEHMAERCALFIIICLGETILATGRTLSNSELTPATFAALVIAFATAFGLWWVYFRFGQSRAAHLIEHTDDPGAVARAIFTYPHILIVAGIILTAVGAEFMLAHPTDVATAKYASAIIGGPALFIVGNLWFKGMVARRPPPSHLAGLSAMAVLMLLAGSVSLLVLGFLTACALIAVAAWETLVLSRAEAH